MADGGHKPGVSNVTLPARLKPSSVMIAKLVPTVGLDMTQAALPSGVIDSLTRSRRTLPLSRR